ncbi:unnamed protein product [Amoebophrya sp. A25]|nr:unnamed protein product [Amoebophrya sp. A25]|eukprot:GSA25T00019759001.1
MTLAERRARGLWAPPTKPEDEAYQISKEKLVEWNKKAIRMGPLRGGWPRQGDDLGRNTSWESPMVEAKTSEDTWELCRTLLCAAGGGFDTWPGESKENMSEKQNFPPAASSLANNTEVARKVINNFDKLRDVDRKKKEEEVKKAYRKNSTSVILNRKKR